MFSFSKSFLTASAFIFSFSLSVGIVDAKSDPMHGRPKFEKMHGFEWIYYMTYFDTDWYLESNGEFKGGIFEIRARDVSPGQDSFQSWRFNCKNKTFTHSYDDSFGSIPADNKLLMGVYNKFCNLPDSLTGSRNR